MGIREVPVRLRQAIIDFSLDDAPRGAVSRFCQEHQISRSVFYKIRSQAQRDGAAQALSPMSRRPRSSPARISQLTEQLVVQIRQDFDRAGWDAGPSRLS